MAHFAQLDDNDMVIQVIVVADDDCKDDDGDESEAVGIAFCKSLFGADTNWAQTSYNHNMRDRYAGIGYTFDRARDAFIAPQPFPSWSLNEATTEWEAPVERPAEGMWAWNEDEQRWDSVPEVEA